MSSRKLIAGSSHASRRTDAGRQSAYGPRTMPPRSSPRKTGSPACADWNGRFSDKKVTRAARQNRLGRRETTAAFFRAFPKRVGYQFARKGMGFSSLDPSRIDISHLLHSLASFEKITRGKNRVTFYWKIGLFTPSEFLEIFDDER